MYQIDFHKPLHIHFIGTGNPEIFFQKDLGKAAHADASDPDEMNMERFMKVYLIHNNLLIYMLFS